MRLVLGNEFTWDGVYDIKDGAAETKYVIVGEIEERARDLKLFTKEAFLKAQFDADAKGRDEVGVAVVGNNPLETVMLRDVANEYGVPVAEVVEKGGLNKSKYTLSLRTRVVGSMLRQYEYSEDQYDVEINDWFVSGDVYAWEFIIVDKHGKVAEAGICDNKLTLEYYDEKDALKTALMLMSLSALSHDMRASNNQAANGMSVSQREPIRIPNALKGEAEGSGLEDAIGMIRDGAEKVGKLTAKFKNK